MNNDNDINSRIERIEEKLNTISALLPQLIDAYEEGQAAIRRLDEMKARNRLRMQNVRAQANLCTHTEKEEAEKRDISPTPPIERKGEEEKELPAYRARACEGEAAGKPVKRPRFVPPTLDEVRAYCEERKNGIDPEEWWNFYESKNWMIGKNKMAKWKSAIVTWERMRRESGSSARFAPRPASHTAVVVRHADNWRGTPKDRIDDPFKCLEGKL